jgi:hypothetical protein
VKFSSKSPWSSVRISNNIDPDRQPPLEVQQAAGAEDAYRTVLPTTTLGGGVETAAAQNDHELGSWGNESKGSDELVGAGEEFPGLDYLATLFT